MNIVLVVDNKKTWNLDLPGVEVVDSTEYLVNDKYQSKNLRVFNLCKSYAYQSSGYYVSLLSSARGHKVIPSTSTILDMKSKELIKIRSEDLDDLLQRSLKDIKSDEFSLSIYFGKNLAQKYDKLAFELHKQFHAPMIRARFKRRDKWRIASVSPVGLRDIPENHLTDLQNFARQYFSRRVTAGSVKHSRFDLAILVNPEEQQPPSDKRAINNFIKAAEKMNISVELIGQNDLNRLGEFDGLFIRETTSVNHHTYRFAQKADALGMVVIDDPLSILRCTNKVFLAELFRRYKIPSPKTHLIHKRNMKDLLATLPLPAVLKQPDSAFSVGVVKAENRAELECKLQAMLEKSDVVVVQEFMPTSFDWRVGILNGEPLYLCKYFMARDHWQIYKGDEGGVAVGEADTIPLKNAPKGLLGLAKKAAGLIGNGLYGLDIKQIGNEFFVIEINDNPSIDGGVEDKILGPMLYERVMDVFLSRMERMAKGVGNDRAQHA
jgi:glutathione synthase/RimK-type ligase-like ATP-grasp enzyme